MKNESAIKSVKLPVTLRPDWFTWLFFVGLPLGLWIPFANTSLRAGIFWPPVCLAGMAVWLYHWNIIIGEHGITYKRLIFLFSHVPYDSIKDVKIELRRPYGRNRAADPFKPVYGLLITPDKTSGVRSMLINIKPFSRRGLATLMQVISAQAPQVQLDKACERMKEKLMPSLFGNEKKKHSRAKI